MNNYNKIKLYKENIINFILAQENKIINLNQITDINYLIGILFLTEMNRYCKTNKISIHGYYIAYSFINLFNKIVRKLIENKKIDYKDIHFFMLSVALNIEYLNNRVDNSNPVKEKINNNYCKFIIEIYPLLLDFIEYNKIHAIDNILVSNNSEQSNIIKNSDKNKIYCDQKCYICWVDKVLSKFFYIVLLTAKFIGSGELKDPNLIKLSEYYANIFYIYLKINNVTCICKNDSYELFNNYTEYKHKLNYSLIQLNFNSDTIDEIVNYLDDFIINKLSINNKFN